MKRILKILGVVVGLVLLFIGFVFYKVYSTSTLDMASKADAIVVLGAAEYAGKPSPVLQARLDHAFDLFKQGFAPIIITTGGTHPGEDFSEGEVGRNYLIKKGIPESQIIAEENSLTTKQNIMRVEEILNDEKLEILLGKKPEKVILVSDPFHMYRAVSIAEDAGIDAVSSPTRTSPISKNKWLEFRYMVREVASSLLHILFDA